MFQVYVGSIEPVQRSLEAGGWPLYAGPRDVWREVGDRKAGQREIFQLRIRNGSSCPTADLRADC